MSETTPPAAEQPIDPWLVERLLADPATAGNDGEQGLATLLAALRAPAAPHELAESDHYVAAFAAAQTLRNSQPSRRKSMLATLLATKTAAAGIAFVAVTATAAAAYTGSLPTTLQNAAHHSVHAPAAHHNHKVDADGKRFTPGPKPTPTPTATPSHPAFRKHHLSPAEAHGLCTAFIKGGPPVPDTARQKLSDEAGDATKIKAFCALVLKHPPYPHPTFTPPIHPTGKPIPFPAVRPTVFPTEAA